MSNFSSTIRTSTKRFRKVRSSNSISSMHTDLQHRIDQLNVRIDDLHVQLSPPPPSITKISSPSAPTHLLESPSSLTATNGFHHTSKRQVNNIQKKKEQELCKQILRSFVLIDEKKSRSLFFSYTISSHAGYHRFFFLDEGQMRADSYFSPSTILRSLQFNLPRCHSISVQFQSFELLNRHR